MSVKRIQRTGRLELHIVGVESWDDFESLANYLVKTFDAVVVDRRDGIYTRTWQFRISDQVLTLKHHEDIGNYFICDNSEPEVMQRIAADLEKRLLYGCDGEPIASPVPVVTDISIDRHGNTAK